MKNGGIFDLDKRFQEYNELEKKISKDNFWQGKEASSVIKKYNHLKRSILKWGELKNNISEDKELLELIKDENDEESISELEESLKNLENQYNHLVEQIKLSGEDDEKNAYLTIHSGAGGTESCDWADMLFRMYSRWIEKKGFKYKIIDKQDGEEAGIRSITLYIEGEYAYGLLKSENGIHRLVRISPFDSNKRRHTSFASVSVVPEIDDTIEVDIQEKDLKIDTFRASGAGGQHVNMTDSAVRITHLPTGIVVSCQNERSQHKNRETAMKILRSRLYDYYKREREKEKEKIEKNKKKIEWGNQIRSYVFHPYVMVKDHRTNVETGNGNGVMDGDIDMFISAYLEKFSQI